VAALRIAEDERARRQTREPAASRPTSVSSRRQPSPAPAGTLIIFRTPPPTMSKDVREFIRPLEGAGLTVVSTRGLREG
jgi:hypothetical protein